MQVTEEYFENACVITLSHTKFNGIKVHILMMFQPNI